MTLVVASPSQIVEAWSRGVMGSEPFANDPAPTIEDPIYYRDDSDQWRSAKRITSPSAMASLASWLHARGLRVPDATQAAWDETNRRAEIKSRLRGRFERALAELDTTDRPSEDDYTVVVMHEFSKGAES